MNEEIIKFFYEDNKSGYKTKEGWLSKNYPDLYNEIETFSIKHDNISFVEKVFLFVHNQKEYPKCLFCGKPTKFKGNLKKGFSDFCSIQCLNKSSIHKDKIKETNIKKYGFDSHNKNPKIKNIKKQSYQDRFGVDNPMFLKEIREKQKKSLIEKYGVDNPMKISHVIEQREKEIKEGSEKNIKRHIERTKDFNVQFIKRENGFNYFKCLSCKNIFKTTSNLTNSRLKINNNICLFCNKNKSYSSILKKIIELLDSYGIYYELNNRKILLGKEIDIYIPEKRVGIEVNGLYWHSSIYKDKDYHLNKTDLSEKQNITLFHFFEDEILNNFDIISSMILNKLGLNENKIYARNTNIKSIDSKIYKKFLNENHIQGYTPTKYMYGLYYKEELVSVMGFGSKRLALGSKHNEKNEYELLRFCNKINTTVIGGASKLLKIFKEKHPNCKIITYANRRYSQGLLYKKLGFVFIHKTKPNYFYIKPGSLIRENRFKYRKSVLVSNGFDPLKTEKDIMLERGFHRIYDSGQLKYELFN